MTEKETLLDIASKQYQQLTVAKSALTGKEFTSIGCFIITEQNYIYSVTKDSAFCVYDPKNEKWSEIVSSVKHEGIRLCEYNPNWIKKPSILDGKVAIQVNNEREFKLLMEHYESKEWKSHDSFMPTTVFNSHLGIKNIFPATVRYENNFGVSYPAHHADNCYAIISFESFAAEVGIKVPVFVMTSENDVPLFFGDPFWHVLKYKDEWKLNTSLGIHNSDKRFVFDEINYKDHMVLVKPEINKAFSTREAAEIWIAEQNKPKQISIELYDSKTAILTKEGVQVTEISSSTKSIWLTPDELSKIVDASSDMFGKGAKGE